MKTFRPYQPEQLLLLPQDMREWLPADHLAHFISEVVDSFDLSAISAVYERELRGNPPWHPQMMVKLWLYAYCVGKPSSRQVERACLEEVPFRVLAANSQPDHRPLSEFRRRHLEALRGLFVQVLRIARKAGLVSLGYVALDGTKIKANASRHKAMSYKRMREEEERLTREIQALLEAGMALDEEEDRRLGKDRRGDELPAELARREQRLRVIQEAKAALEAEAQAAAAQAQGSRDAEPVEQPPAAAPKDKAQRNFTDPQSRIMKNGEKAFVQAYNCQAMVDSKAQMIVACAVSNQAADAPHLGPMLERVTENCGQTPQRMSADAGYRSEGNLGVVEEQGIDAYIATGKDKHNIAPPPAPRGRIPRGLSAKERMARKVQTKAGKRWYGKRKGLVEPVFGQIKQGRRFLQFLLRGQEKTSGEWSLICTGHNLLRMWRVKCAGGAAGRAIGRELGLNPA